MQRLLDPVENASWDTCVQPVGIFCEANWNEELHVREQEVGQLFHRNVQYFRGGIVLKAHRLFYHSMLGSREIEKKKKELESDKPSRERQFN